MKDYIPSKASMFLVELIVAVLFFTIASAVCVQLFAKAHTLNQNTAKLNEAVSRCQSMAEVLDACHGSLEQVEVVFPQSVRRDGSLLLYFDRLWQECSPSQSSYCLELNLSQDKLPWLGNISVRDTKEPAAVIFSMDAAVTPVSTVTS